MSEQFQWNKEKMRLNKRIKAVKERWRKTYDEWNAAQRPKYNNRQTEKRINIQWTGQGKKRKRD